MTKTVWLTGLSGAGKSTLANALAQQLKDRGTACTVLDGDELRRGLCSDLGYSAVDRSENIRRVAEVAAILNKSGLVVIAALISPLVIDRSAARRIIGESSMLEVHVATALSVCERRDPKGLYRRARHGEISNFTGIDLPYEEPSNPILRLDTADLSVPECLSKIMISLQEEI